MNDENPEKGESTSVTKLFPHLPELDDISSNNDNISITSSVLEMTDTIHLSIFERLLPDGMLCSSGSEIIDDSDKDEANTEVPDENVNNNVMLLSDSKDHQDNIPFVIYPTGTGKSINNDRSLIYGTTSTATSDISEELRSRHQNDDNTETRQRTAISQYVKLRSSNESVNYNEQSDRDDGDYSPTDGSDYIEDSEKKRKKKNIFTKRDKKSSSINKITVQALIDNSDITSKVSCPRVLASETPEKVYEKQQTRRSILICEESIEKDFINLDEKNNRSLDETIKDSEYISKYNSIYGIGDTNALELNIADDIIEPSTPKYQRSWKRRNCCIYCEDLVTNFTRHLQRKHSEEIEVIKLMSITDPDPKIQKKNRQVFTDDLRNRGNYIHNSKVVSSNEGHLIPKRQKCGEELTKSPSSFVICKTCLGTYRRSTFYRHSKKCNKDHAEDLIFKNSLARHAINILPAFTHISKEFIENILPRLRNDEISLIVQQDPLIVAYGCRLLKKKKEKRSRKAICSKMRDLAHILKIVREKNPEIVQLKDLINPKYYDYFIEAVKKMSGFDEETGFVKVISIAARVRPEILGCIEIIYTNTIMDSKLSTAHKDHIKNQINEFKILLESNWQWEISSNSEKTRKRNLMMKPQVMPYEKDIEKVMAKIHELEEKYFVVLKRDITAVTYENLCEVTIAHIILLDRKRSGDVAEAELEFYINRKTDEIPTKVLESLDENQKNAISELDIFQIPGKRGRAVPILLTKIMRRNIDLLITCRSILNISSNNKYLFARPFTNEPFNGGRCLNIIKSMCTLKKPEMLTSTGLRHHIATISQVHTKTDKNYTQHLATFLGHDLSVHASNYRLPIQAIQKGLVGSRLLEIEDTYTESTAKSSRPDNISLNEIANESDNKNDSNESKNNVQTKANVCDEQIYIDEYTNSEKSSETDNENEYEKNEIDKNNTFGSMKSMSVLKSGHKSVLDTESDESSEGKRKQKRNLKIISDDESNEQIVEKKPKRPKRIKNIINDEESDEVDEQKQNRQKRELVTKKIKITKRTQQTMNDEKSDEEVVEETRKRRKKSHNIWSKAEIAAVMRHLKPFVVKKKNPGKALCVEVLGKEPILHKRTWMQINSYVNNIYKKDL